MGKKERIKNKKMKKNFQFQFAVAVHITYLWSPYFAVHPSVFLEVSHTCVFVSLFLCFFYEQPVVSIQFNQATLQKLNVICNVIRCK